jgi:selenoprotein W-related protein
LTEQLVSRYPAEIASLTLIPSSGGRFEVKVGEELIFSKKTLGRHAEPGEIVKILEDKYGFVVTPEED